MIIHARNQQEYDDTLRLLAVINVLRDQGPGYQPPIVEDTPWVTTYWAKEVYL